MNLIRCDQCKHTQQAYKTPYGWRMCPYYEDQVVKSGAKRKKTRKRVFVDFHHLCPTCVKDGYYFLPNAVIARSDRDTA